MEKTVTIADMYELVTSRSFGAYTVCLVKEKESKRTPFEIQVFKTSEGGEESLIAPLGKHSISEKDKMEYFNITCRVVKYFAGANLNSDIAA